MDTISTLNLLGNNNGAHYVHRNSLPEHYFDLPMHAFSLDEMDDGTLQSFNPPTTPSMPLRSPGEQTVPGLINEEYDGAERDLLGEEDEDIMLANDGEEVKISQMHTTLEAAMKNVLVCLIGEYLTEVITLRIFLSKVRQILCTDSNANNKEVFTWILRCMLECSGGHVHRMASFLEEHGVTKYEIDASSASIKEEHGYGELVDYAIGEKRKKREKKSISRGLRSAPNKWSKNESQMLIRLVHENGDKSWKRIAEQLGGGKTGAQCAQHWKRVLSPQIRKGSWDDQEEELLLSLVERYGQSWKNIAGEIKSRTDIQCRYQFQKSCLSRQCAWVEQEDALLAKKVTQILHETGASSSPAPANIANVPWVDVAKFIARAKLTKIPRTALECKQRWNSLPSSTLTYLNSTNNSTNTTPPTNSNNNIRNNSNINNTTITKKHPPTTPSNFHNINYNNVNNNFTMVTTTY